MKKMIVSLVAVTFLLVLTGCDIFGKSSYDKVFLEIDAFYENLDAGNITEDINLPVSSAEIPDAIISWSSNKQNVIDNSGIVIIPLQDTEVTLTVSVDINEIIKKKSYLFTVIGQGDGLDKEPIFTDVKDIDYLIGSGVIDYLGEIAATDYRGNDITNLIEVDSSQVNLTAVGEYEIIYRVTDSEGNSATKSAYVNVLDDITKKPLISGVANINYTIGSGAINYLDGITAVDYQGNDITGNIEVDSSEVQLNKVGQYQIVYRVTDLEGNSASTSAYVHVINGNITINWAEIPYYSSLTSSQNNITDLAMLLRGTVNYVAYSVSTDYDVINTRKGGQYILYDTTSAVIPLGGWPSGGNFNIDGYGTYSVDREHVWACNDMRIRPINDDRTLDGYVSFVINNSSFNYRPDSSSRGHFSDMHNLWSAVRTVNQSLHSDHFFGAPNGHSVEPYLRNNLFYPGSEYIGDIARILFYMTLMYPHLTLVNSGSSETEGSIYYGYLDVLLAWDETDPVSAEEISRNNMIFSRQGNRNPFIDFYGQGIIDLVFADGDPNILD